MELLLDELVKRADFLLIEKPTAQKYREDICRRWNLPATYWILLERCCGIRTVWANDTYTALELWGLDRLLKGQEGYAYHPAARKVLLDWEPNLVVIASDSGNPYCLDLCRQDTAVFWAEHGTGTWHFQPAFPCLEDFVASILATPTEQENDAESLCHSYHYVRLTITAVSDSKRALVFLKQYFDDESYQQTKERLHHLPLLLYSGLETGADTLEKQLRHAGFYM